MVEKKRRQLDPTGSSFPEGASGPSATVENWDVDIQAGQNSEAGAAAQQNSDRGTVAGQRGDVDIAVEQISDSTVKKEQGGDTNTSFRNSRTTAVFCNENL